MVRPIQFKDGYIDPRAGNLVSKINETTEDTTSLQKQDGFEPMQLCSEIID